MFVTAASSNHFKSAKQFIKSLNSAPCIFYDIGLTGAEADEIKMLPVEYRLFDWSCIPVWGHITAPNAGSYAWKSAIISIVIKENYDILIWCDAGNIILNQKELESYVKDVHLYTPDSEGNLQRWSSRACLDGMNISKDMRENCNMRNAAIIGFLPGDPDIQTFVEEWKKECQNPELIQGSRMEHRHDQSILSCLFHLRGRSCTTNCIGVAIHRDCD